MSYYLVSPPQVVSVCVGCYNLYCQPCKKRDEFALTRHRWFSRQKDEKLAMEDMKKEIARLSETVASLATAVKKDGGEQSAS